MALLGYSDRLSARPGGELSFFVSTEDPSPYNAQLIRLRGIDQTGDAIRALEEPCAGSTDATYPGRHQNIALGSSLAINTPEAPSVPGLALTLWCMPTMCAERRQVLADIEIAEDCAHLVLAIGTGGCVELELSGPAMHRSTVPLPEPVVPWQWVCLRAGLGPDEIRLSINGPRKHWTTVERPIGGWNRVTMTSITFAATSQDQAHFNGRIEDPALHAWSTPDNRTPLASWDFARDVGGRRVTDIGPHGWHGLLINGPTRAVLGHRWDRRSVRYTDDPTQWNAIHFHDDDLAEANWEVDFTYSVPADMTSGIYAFKLTQGSEIEYLPFYVTPTSPAAAVLFIAPTNTYTAYASEHLWEGERGDAHAKLMGAPITLDRAEDLLHSIPGLGRSLYDTHSDGSGVMYATKLRPMVNMRPNYVNWLSAGRRHFSADLFITGWLERLGIAFDVITDEDLDERGLEALRSYDVVITGSHPEYPTVAEIVALEQYSDAGGNIMYLGANGFYWVTSYLDDTRTGIEVRRGYTAQRNWNSHPAELYHSSTGELGGAWRHRGYDTNPLFGIGMAAVGWAGAAGYHRTPDSHDPELRWVFDGVTSNPLGEQGFVLGGAAGDELDCADAERGTPTYARILLSSRHNELYYPAIEVRKEIGPGQDGAHNPDVRADVVLIDHPAAGSVFSVGSICWAGAMGWNDYDNDVARLTSNVLRRFLSAGAREVATPPKVAAGPGSATASSAAEDDGPEGAKDEV